MENEAKKRIYSGMQATGTLTLGNYLGALRNWVAFSDEYDCIYGIMDLHSLTVRQEPAEFRRNARSFYALYTAAGLDPEKNIVYYQSHVGAHAELSWILSCFTYMGELNRMTQFKDKSKRHADNVNAGLYTYPVLMAADILLYQADMVPVGADQKQHVELCRDICLRFNSIYGDVFTVPEPFIPKAGAKIMSLADPLKKMSKSDENPNATVLVLDDRDTVIRKFKRAVTDSDTEVRYDPQNKPGVSNLMTIYGCVTGKAPEEIQREFEGKGYGDFKAAVGEAVSDCLAPIRQRYDELMKEKSWIDARIKENDEKAARIAYKTLRKVQKKVGLTEQIR